MVVWHHGLQDSIMSDRNFLFTLKFWSLLCYFLEIKCRLSTAFYLQLNGQTMWQNSIIKTYLQAFVNFKQNNWGRFLSMAEFVYNNAKNTTTGHTPFEFNCKYHLYVLYKKDINSRFKSKTANKLSTKLKELIIVYCKNLYHAQKL